MSVLLHEAIVKNNILERPTDKLSRYFEEHPTALKAALFVNHLFRAAAMAGLLMMLPYGVAANATICLAGSLFYRLSVEDLCAYKFALPALAGAEALLIGRASLARLVSGTCFSSFALLAHTALGLAPLALYLGYVHLTINYDVDYKPCRYCTKSL